MTRFIEVAFEEGVSLINFENILSINKQKDDTATIVFINGIVAPCIELYENMKEKIK